MRHNKSGRKLKRTASHRKATLSALCVALLKHKRIQTTTAKAKETRMVVEKIITKAKNAVAKEGTGAKDVHARRDSFAFLRDRIAVSTLYNDVAPKVSTRPGGYTRVVKLGRRFGDGAEVAILELVDFNIGQEKAAPKTAKKTAAKKPAAKKTKKSAPKEKATGDGAPPTEEPKQEDQPKG